MIRFLPALGLFALICWVVDLANRGGHHALLGLLLSLPLGDKLGHFLLYGGLAGVLDWAWRQRDTRLPLLGRVPTAACVVLVFSTLEEVSQLFTATRSPDVVDLLANLLGVSAFCAVSRWLSAPSARSQSSPRHPP
jgi:hypothetical protein